jgi:hypothetical protein
VLEDAAGHAAVLLHPATVGQPSARVLDAAQGELEQASSALLGSKGGELVANKALFTSHG